MKAIITERLFLRAVTLDDLMFIHSLHSLPETDKYNTLGMPTDINTTELLLREWLKASAELPVKKIVLLIKNKAYCPIGVFGINMGKPNYDSAEIWYKFHKDFWNLGYATESVKAVLNFGFKELKLHRIEAGCAVGNIASERVLLKAGFIKEGRSRKKLPIRGEWQDNFSFAILEEDYLA